jgi:hypothetical protein
MSVICTVQNEPKNHERKYESAHVGLLLLNVLIHRVPVFLSLLTQYLVLDFPPPVNEITPATKKGEKNSDLREGEPRTSTGISINRKKYKNRNTLTDCHTHPLKGTDPGLPPTRRKGRGEI